MSNFVSDNLKINLQRKRASRKSNRRWDYSFAEHGPSHNTHHSKGLAANATNALATLWEAARIWVLELKWKEKMKMWDLHLKSCTVSPAITCIHNKQALFMYLEMGGKGKEAMDRRPNKWGPWKVLERERGTEEWHSIDSKNKNHY